MKKKYEGVIKKINNSCIALPTSASIINRTSDSYLNLSTIKMVSNFARVARIHEAHPSSLKSSLRSRMGSLDYRHDANKVTKILSPIEDESERNDTTQPSPIDLYKGEHHSIQCMEEALSLQKAKLGKDNPIVTKTLRGLALEYKASGQYDEAIYCLKQSLNLVSRRQIIPPSFQTFENEEEKDYSSSESSMSIRSLDSSLSNESEKSCSISGCSLSPSSSHDSLPENQNVHLLQTELTQERAVIYSCLGNIYKLKGMFKEATHHYGKSVNMLVEAGFPCDSPMVSMMMRIIKRAENERRQNSIKD